MVSLQDPEAHLSGYLWPEQAISLEQALKIYTLNGARALKLEDSTDSIAVGKSAEIIVLNQNLFDNSVEAISETKVEMTLFAGQVVYSREAH